MAGLSRTDAVLVTGCSTGIGRATADLLATDGWNVYATARNPETLADLKAKGAKVLALDVVDEASRDAAVKAVLAESGSIGGLVNNAGYGLEGPVETTPMSEIRRQMETNWFGAVALCQAVLPGMREQGKGRIVNISSMGGRLTLPGGAFYHSSKYALEAFSDALRWETAGFGIGVTIIEPGIIHTAFGDTAHANIDLTTAGGGPGDPYADFTRSISTALASAYTGPMSRLGTGPETVAKAIRKALSSRRAPARTIVGADARSLLMVRRLLPARAFDAALTTQYRRPRR